MLGANSRYLFPALIVWAALTFLILHAVGDPAEALAPIVAVERPKAPVPEPAPKAPEPRPEPEAAPEDEFAGWPLCSPGTSGGAGNFGAPSLRYDEAGRMVLRIPYSGAMGQYKSLQELDSARPVIAVDFHGAIGFGQAKIVPDPPDGAVKLVALGDHKAFTRISVNFASGKVPGRVERELYCQEGAGGGEVAMRLTFVEGPVWFDGAGYGEAGSAWPLETGAEGSGALETGPAGPDAFGANGAGLNGTSRSSEAGPLDAASATSGGAT